MGRQTKGGDEQKQKTLFDDLCGVDDSIFHFHSWLHDDDDAAVVSQV